MGARPGLFKVRSLKVGMPDTRSHSDKSEINEQYKSAIGGADKLTDKDKKFKVPKASAPYTSTPTIPSSGHSSKKIDFSADGSVFEKTLVGSSAPGNDSDGSGDETIKPLGKGERPYIGPIKKEKIMAQNNPFATLKYAVDAVPFFDGKNIPLSYFIEGCEEAKSMLPQEAESQFAKILRTRIVGEARRTIRDEDFDTVSDLTKFLKQIYGGTKNAYQLQGELGNVYQKADEDIVTYANRVKLLGKQILEAYRSSGYGVPGQDTRQTIEKDMCKCFIRGLKPEIEQRIARDLDVKATVADALRIEKELRAISDLRYGNNASQIRKQDSRSIETCQICFKIGHTATNCRKFASKNDLGSEILICQICKKRGHGADKCRSRNPQAHQLINTIQESAIKCQLCSKTGHSAKNCYQNNRSKQINNASNNNRFPIICQWCDKQGHLANNCWKKQNEQANANNQNKVTCQICNNHGHTAKECRSNGNRQPNSNAPFCRYCKEQGHLLENCQLRIANQNRRKEGNSGNGSGPSKMGVPQGSDQTSRPTQP